MSLVFKMRHTSSRQLNSGALKSTLEYLGSIGNEAIFFPSTVNFVFVSLSIAPEIHNN